MLTSGSLQETLLEKAMTRKLDKNLAQAQFFQDLARFGFGIMQPGKPGESFAAQAGRVGQETQIGQNTLNILAKQKAAKDQQDRALKLAAIQGAEAERSAAIKASAAAKAARLKDERAALREWFKYKSSTSTKKSLGQSAVDGSGAKIMLEEVVNVIPTPGKVFSKTDGNYNFANSEIKRTVRAQLDGKGKPVVTGLPPNVVAFNVQRADGTEVVYTRNQDGTNVQPLTYNGNVVVAKQPTFKWEQSQSADGRIRFALRNQQTGAVKEGEGNSYEVDPTKFETITTKGVNGEDVILQYPVNAEGERIGDPVPVFRGEGQSKIITIGKSLYQLTPDADGVFTYRPIITGAPEIKTDGKGQLGFVYPPNVSWVDENGIDRSPEENPDGRFVPLTGAEGKAEDFEFKTFVNNSTKRVSTLRRKKGSRQFFDLSTGQPVTDEQLSGMTDISGETAYESMTKAEARARRRDMLNKAVQGRLQEQFRGFDDAQIESWVDSNQGAGLL